MAARPELGAAPDIAENSRAAIESIGIPAAEAGCVTVSVGVAALVPADAVSPNDLIVLADTALYAAKRTGRSRVETCERLHPVS